MKGDTNSFQQQKCCCVYTWLTKKITIWTPGYTICDVQVITHLVTLSSWIFTKVAIRVPADMFWWYDPWYPYTRRRNIYIYTHAYYVSAYIRKFEFKTILYRIR